MDTHRPDVQDLIGNLNDRAQRLRGLLERLGYRDSAYRNPQRLADLVGAFSDRSPPARPRARALDRQGRLSRLQRGRTG